MSLLEGELADIINDALEGADLPFDLTLTREVPGSTEPPYSPWNPGPPTTATHACRGFVDDYRADQRDGTLIHLNDRKIVILAPSIAVTPVPGDKLTARGQTYTVVTVQADPALATFICQVRQ